ncbi:phosphoribosyltransferase [Mucilaginibacter sp.]
MIGDTWLDIEMGRALNVPTVLTSFYKDTNTENRDGIGQDWKQLKSGATYCISKFDEIFDIIGDPTKKLLAVESIFLDVNSKASVKFKTNKYHDRLIIYRSLGRQQGGECDKYAVADKYFEFHRADRSHILLDKLSKATSNYILHVQESMPNLKWDFFSYVSDKATTQPPNKLLRLFELIDTNIPKINLICWSDDITGSIRNQKDYRSRVDFVDQYVFIDKQHTLLNKNVIIIDDQFTTGGTAQSICKKLTQEGAKNILFVTLFYLISIVESEKVCPHCSTKLQVKIKRSDGTKFLSCVPKKFGGRGCGNFIQNIQ